MQFDVSTLFLATCIPAVSSLIVFSFGYGKLIQKVNGGFLNVNKKLDDHDKRLRVIEASVAK